MEEKTVPSPSPQKDESTGTTVVSGGSEEGSEGENNCWETRIAAIDRVLGNGESSPEPNARGGGAEPLAKRLKSPPREIIRHRQPYKGPDHFVTLSDEIILKIFSLLPKRWIASAAATCSRFHRLSQDESLWTRLDLAARSLPPDTLSYVLSRGVKILRLAFSVVQHPIFLSTKSYMDIYVSKLEYLDLTCSTIKTSDLRQLLDCCRCLRKLSLEMCSVDDRCCVALSKNHNLDTLNLAMVQGLSSVGLALLLKCSKLISLNLAWTGLDVEGIGQLSRHLPGGVRHLNLSGCHKSLSVQDLPRVLGRVPELAELDLSDCLSLTDAVCSFLPKLCPHLHTLSLSRCYKVSTAELLVMVDRLPTLERLNVFHIQGLTRPSLPPRLTLNQDLFSTVARPTVGIRRTSIWDLRTRDCRRQ